MGKLIQQNNVYSFVPDNGFIIKFSGLPGFLGTGELQARLVTFADDPEYSSISAGFEFFNLAGIEQYFNNTTAKICEQSYLPYGCHGSQFGTLVPDDPNGTMFFSIERSTVPTLSPLQTFVAFSDGSFQNFLRYDEIDAPDEIGNGDGFRILGNQVLLYGSRVSFGAVPEPTSWSILIGGFLLTGLIARRERRAVEVSRPNFAVWQFARESSFRTVASA